MSSNVTRAHSCRIGRSDHRAHRCPGDDGGLDSEFVKDFERRDVREPARAAGP